MLRAVFEWKGRKWHGARTVPAGALFPYTLHRGTSLTFVLDKEEA